MTAEGGVVVQIVIHLCFIPQLHRHSLSNLQKQRNAIRRTWILGRLMLVGTECVLSVLEQTSSCKICIMSMCTDVPLKVVDASDGCSENTCGTNRKSKVPVSICQSERHQQRSETCHSYVWNQNLSLSCRRCQLLWWHVWRWESSTREKDRMIPHLHPPEKLRKPPADLRESGVRHLTIIIIWITCCGGEQISRLRLDMLVSDSDGCVSVDLSSWITAQTNQ